MAASHEVLAKTYNKEVERLRKIIRIRTNQK
jgi:hypothetical protein